MDVTGNVSVGGTLTYEDVTNIDSVGLVTARSGLVVGTGVTLSKDGDGFYTGIVTATTFVGGLTGNWSDAEAASGAKCLTSSSTCATFTCFKGVSLDIQQAVEKRIDGGTPGATNNAGSIRYAGAGKYLCKQGAVFPVTSAVN